MFPVTAFYISITALLTALILIPPISRLAIRVGGIDSPDERKIHQEDMPRLGGVAIFMACMFSVLFFSDMQLQIKGYLAGGAIIFITGLADDLNGLKPIQKFAGEIMAATVVVVSGKVCLSSLGNLFGTGEIFTGWLSVPFTIFAIVGVTNAINLLDGLDGLAGGVTAVISACFCLLAWQTQNWSLLALASALLGSVLGFLNYNTYPARIFMGDSGSLFLGYSLGVFSVLLVTGGSSASAVSPVTPLLMLGVPIFDTLFVMVNRFRKRRSLFLPDRSHIHHRLLDLGLGHTATVFIVYSVTYALCLLVLFVKGVEDWLLLIIFTAGAGLFYAGIKITFENGGIDCLKTLIPEFSFKYMTMRKLVVCSTVLMRAIKYILLFILLFSWITPFSYNVRVIAIAAVLFVLTVVSSSVNRFWANRLMQAILYAGSATVIFLMDNLGRSFFIFGISATTAGNLLYGILAILVFMEILIRRRTGLLTSTPFEYFILFIAMIIPLLPASFASSYHLLAVTAKSIIVFMAYKLILMDDSMKNKKIILALAIALLGYLIRPLLKI